MAQREKPGGVGDDGIPSEAANGLILALYDTNSNRKKKGEHMR